MSDPGSSGNSRATGAASDASAYQRAAAIASGEPDTERAINGVLAELRSVVPFDSASVQQLRDSRLVIVGGVGFADLDVILGESFDINNSGSPNGEVVHARRPIAVGDTEQYRAFRRGLHVGQGIRSWLGVPLITGPTLLGIVALDKTEPDFYTDHHKQLASRFAALLARRFTTL